MEVKKSGFVEDSGIGWSRFMESRIEVLCSGERITERYSADGHGDGMYFGTLVKYQNIDLALAYSGISEYFWQLLCVVAAVAAWSYLLTWRSCNMEVLIALFSTYTSSNLDRRSGSTSILVLLEQGGRKCSDSSQAFPKQVCLNRKGIRFLLHTLQT